jgi:hypothetical protein
MLPMGRTLDFRGSLGRKDVSVIAPRQLVDRLVS